jgi:uncharacterized protein (DUF2235 family)
LCDAVGISRGAIRQMPFFCTDFTGGSMSAEPVPAPAVTPAWRGKKIVIFADGTGNSFTTQESNIWRLYAALDKTEKSGATPAELQLARYIPGVGTASNRVLRLIDGATGIGVPSNVRKLYRFLCWNWQPGDEIYLFGFSRGAFTVRTLAGSAIRCGPGRHTGRPRRPSGTRACGWPPGLRRSGACATGRSR